MDEQNKVDLSLRFNCANMVPTPLISEEMEQVFWPKETHSTKNTLPMIPA